MDTRERRSKSLSNPSRTKSMFARTLHKVISFNGATAKIASAGAMKEDASLLPKPANEQRRNEALQALLAKLFAEITSMKATYAELQVAQNPYDSEAIQSADQALVASLTQLSELKHRFLGNALDDVAPHVTLMLAEIQEQQSLLKTYEITARNLQADSQAKSLTITALCDALNDALSSHKSLESKHGCSTFESLSLKDLFMVHFVQFLNHTMKSVKIFVKLLMREMEAAEWDIEMAVKAIDPSANASHRSFVFESFVCRGMLHGFENPKFAESNGLSSPYPGDYYYSKFKKTLRVSDIGPFLSSQSRDTSFCRFLRRKYLGLVHSKMESSIFRSLNRRKMVASEGLQFPGDPFFLGFAEMARRVWCLNLLGFSFGFSEVGVFEVRKGSRFSEMYMECVEDCGGDDVRVGLTVVPGFKIGPNLIPSQVLLWR